MYCVAYNFISLYEKMNSKSVGVRNFRFILFHSRFFLEVCYLLPYCSCFISIFSLPSILLPSLSISHIFFPLISFPSPHSYLLPLPSLMLPSLSSPSLPSLSCHLLSYHFISFHLIGDYTHQINSSSGSGSSSNFSHLFDWVKIAHR